MLTGHNVKYKMCGITMDDGKQVKEKKKTLLHKDMILVPNLVSVLKGNQIK